MFKVYSDFKSLTQHVLFSAASGSPLPAPGKPRHYTLICLKFTCEVSSTLIQLVPLPKVSSTCEVFVHDSNERLMRNVAKPTHKHHCADML